MTSRPSRFPAAAKRRQPAQLGSGPVAMLVASLIAAAVFFQPPAYSAEATFAPVHGEAAICAPRLTAQPRSPSSKSNSGSATTSAPHEVSKDPTPLPAVRILRD